VTGGLFRYRVWTNAGVRDDNPWFLFSRQRRLTHAAWAMLTPAELGTVQYIDYPYWTDFSGGTRLAADGARRLGPWRDQPAGTIYRQIAENARDGRLPPPIILISEPGLANLVVIEGHKRHPGTENDSAAGDCMNMPSRSRRVFRDGLSGRRARSRRVRQAESSPG